MADDEQAQRPSPSRFAGTIVAYPDDRTMRPERALAAVASHLPVRGRESLAFALFERGRGGRGWWTVRLTGGLEVVLPVASRQTWTAAFAGAYDAPSVDLLVSHLRPGTVALDIGASLGLYTVQLAARARALGGSTSVVAVEPVPANAAIVRDNLARNGLLPFAAVIEVALGDTEGVLSMSVERGGAGNATVVTGLVDADVARHVAVGGLEPAGDIPVRTLDSLAFDAPVSVVKMDAEGFEMAILGGGEGFVARHRPVIYGEFSEEWMRSRGRDVDEPFAWARDHGYTVQAVALVSSGLVVKRTRLEVSPIESSHDRGATELLLTPQERMAVTSRRSTPSSGS